jgi:hypothetical protein
MSRTVPKYFHCATFRDLAKTITKHIFTALDHPQNHGCKRMEKCRLHEPLAHYAMGAIDFKVEDTPTKDEWKKMKAKDRANAWDGATGCYGIKEVGQMFDDPSVFLLVGGYYGGAQLIPSPTIDMETTKDDLYATVFCFLQHLLQYEDDPENRCNFIVKIDYEK